MLKTRIVLAPMVALMMVALPLLITPVPAQAAPVNGSLTTSILQTFGNGNSFAGTLTITGFTLVNGVVNAAGTIVGTLTSSTGQVIGTINHAITLPLTGFTGTCTILTLHVGAINLSLLGLNVALNPIDLVITATAAPGNLLGNLLCSVAHLLDSNGSLANLTTLLNEILGALRL